MAKRLNVSLGFTADTAAAKAALQDLQKSLTSLSNSAMLNTKKLGLTQELNEAANAASQLKIKLQEATTPTGSLDLGKFNQSLKASGQDLQYYAAQLKMLGPEGQQAFSQLAQSITLAEVPLRKSSKLLSEFATTMKNTVRWQLSSSMLHGFMGAIQSATGYAKDLNKSLNNIRIVTGQNADQMANFAVKANEAAKALSATTTEYTNAALIYYQQGLSDEDVQKRTDLTIKMANVSGQSAEVVSDQLTAIWNNFAEGSDDLEHFADVLTKLGAETASSSDEIAQGMEKFAAIGEMIGLSYDNAAAALATVTAETRQSADVVGTAFKTIFARIQGLSLGDTLDDGTNLNKYSEALNKVGISIFEQNGELKDMDNILAEMGAKWELLSKDQQVALAQTVAGVRQYNQLVALMDNYDIYQENIERAQNSEGTLQEQADIYAESWEGARDRVTAAAEKIYQTLLDDDAFIDILNITEDLVSGLGGFIDAIGGLKGVLPIVATLMMKSFGPDIASSIDRIGYNIKLRTKAGRDEILQLRQDAIAATKDIYDNGTIAGSAMVDVGKIQSDLQKSLLEKTLDLEKSNKELTSEEQKRAQLLLDQNKLLTDQYAEITKNVEASEDLTEDLLKRITAQTQNKVNGEIQVDVTTSTTQSDGSTQVEKNTKKYNSFKDAIKEAGDLQKTYKQSQQIIKAYGKAINGLSDKTDKASDDFKNLQSRIQKMTDAADKSGAIVDGKLNEALKELGDAAASGNITKMQEIIRQIGIISEDAGVNAFSMFESIRQSAQNAGVDMERFNPILDKLQAQFEETGQLTAEQIQLFTNLGIQFDNAGKIINGFNGKVATVGDAIGTSVTAAVSLGTALTQVQNAIKNLYTNEDASGLEKFVSILMLATTATQAFQSVQKAGKTIDEAIAGVKARKAAATAAAAAAQTGENVVTATGTGLINANKIAWLTHPILGVIAVALMAVVGVITAVNEKIKKNSEELQASADAAREEAEAAREVEKANRDNLQTMNELLSVYEKTGEGKEDLDKITRTLAEAYNIEAGALATLTGNYADYKKVSDAAYEAHKAELEKQLELEEDALTAQENALKDTAIRTKLDGSGNSVYEWNGESRATLTFDGYGNENEIVNALAGMGLGFTRMDWNDVVFDYSLEDPESIVEAYDKIVEAKEKLRETEGISEAELKDSGIYEDMDAWLDAMKDDVEEYRVLLEQVNKIKDELGQFGETEEVKESNAALIDELQNVSSLEEYQAWITKITQAFKSAGIQGEELDKRLKTLTDNSFNPLIKTFKTQDDALTELSSKVGKNKQELTDFFNALDEDAKTYFWQINLRADEETWQQQIEILKYKAEQEKIQVQIEAVTAAQSSLKEDMSKEDYEKLRESGIDWGNAEEGIIEFSEFVKMSYEEQANFLNSLSSKYRDNSLQNIAVTKQEMEERKAIIEKELDETLAYIENQDLPEPKRVKYEADAEALSKELEQLEKDLDNIDADIEIDLIIDQQEDIKELQSTFDKIKDSITPLTNIFDSIASGIKKTMDDSGNAVWGFSKEAVQAVESIYPGFMQNLTLLKDGTFAVSNEMYQAIFDAENGALLANTEATAGKLQNLATEAYAKADYYEQAAQAAYELAKGEVDANGVVKEDKQKTLLDAVKNTQEADSDIVTMTEETLGQQLEADNQYRAALEGTAEYQSTSTEEAAKNMAYNTASGSAAAMTNLGKVRDAAYAAAKQIAQIGSDAPQFETFDEALQWDAIGRVDIKAADTSTIDSLVKTIGSQLDLNIGDGENDDAEKSAAYQALGDSFSQIAAQWREAGNTAMATLSELLGSVDDASDAMDEIDENASKALADLAERYHEITREITAQEHALNKLEKAKNRAFGGDKLNYIAQEIEGYKNLQTEQNNLYLLRLADLELDKLNLQKQFNNGVQFNDKNEITNFTALYNAGNEEQRKALEEYEKTLDALRDQEMVLEDIFDKLQELHYEKLTYKLELELNINDEALKELEYKLKQMENNFFKMAEMATLTYSNRTLIEDSYGDLTTFESALKADYSVGKISQSQYIEGLQNVRDNVYGLVDSLMELDDTMTHYYGDTLTAGAEKLSMYTAEMDQLVSVLDHYMNLADILGKSKDYEMMGNFLQGKADIIADELAIATKDYDYLAAKKAEIQNIFFNMKPDDENYDYWEEQWRAISEATNEAQETLLSKTEEWAESMKAVIENNLAAAADNLENLLTGDTSFNEMMTELERLNERQEEFLTKTNQVYETNKMIRTAQSAIDKTDNIAAKTKLNNFVKETEALQEKNQLSSYELELQQAKYDLLLAEIALAEAQNAKSTVRLSRDDEGNFGYVYTADQDAIDKAEQELEDAENALYNKSLEGINEYTEKYTQAKRDMYDKLTQLQTDYLNGEIASEEEYNRLREQILEHYLGPNGILTQYQDLYRIAVSANSAAAEEAWNDDYIDMTEDVEDLKDAVDEYLKEIDEDFVTWQTVSTTANTTVKGALDDSKTATDNLTTASDTLRKEIEDELLPALQSEYDMVWAEVEAYAAKRTEVKGLIQDYLNYINTLNSVIVAEARKEAADNKPTETPENPATEDPAEKPSTESTLAVGSSVTVKSSATHFSRDGGNGTKMKSYVPGNDFIVKSVSGNEVLIGDPHGPNYKASGITGWVKKSDLVGFLTGGYTGVWGPEGKLALLHQKELILNAQDTENMLGIIMAVREIMNSIDKQATWASSGLGMLTAAGYNSMSQNLEQTVTIHAEFPNATNHSEIEEAFNTLINRASQYANRK